MGRINENQRDWYGNFRRYRSTLGEGDDDEKGVTML